MTVYQQYGKRVFDFVVALTLLIITFPLLMILALAALAAQGAPLLFRQPRPGLHEKIFLLYKFRTMADQRDANGNLLADQTRLTSLGRWLRSTSLDELPTLYNVVRGDMSLVGPRPLLVEYLPRYDQVQRRRHEVRPGITGWAQINGRNALSWDAKFTLDIWYVDHVSFKNDLLILIKTLGTVFTRRGISAANHATMPEFIGNPGAPSVSYEQPQQQNK